MFLAAAAPVGPPYTPDLSATAMILILLASIALIVVLIMVFKLSAFISLIVACFFLGILTQMPIDKIAGSITAGMGSTLSSLAIILGLGTILGKMLEISGGSERLAQALINKLGVKNAHWALMIVGFVCGIPVFFQVGLVLLVPLVFSVAKESKMNLVKLGISVVMGLLTVHCIVPPHPAAFSITQSLHADVGTVIMYGLIVGLPIAIISGPIWGSFISKNMKLSIPAAFSKNEEKLGNKPPSLGATLLVVLLPIAIMITKTIIDIAVGDKDIIKVAGADGKLVDQAVPQYAGERFVDFLCDPVMALLISVFVAYFILGLARGMKMKQILSVSEASFGPVAGILLIIGCGGAFNKVITDSGMGKIIGDVLKDMDLNLVIVAWIVAIIMRFSVGSATVAMITSAGIVGQLVIDTGANPAVICIAIGTGAIGLSHVNDSGFWTVKEFFGMELKDCFKAYTSATTIAAVIGLGLTLILNAVVG